MNYRHRLYENYVTGHFDSVREISIEDCDRSQKFLGAYFGRFLPKDRGAKILDIGCGYGAFLHFLQKEGYLDIRGVDVGSEQVEAARRLGINNIHLGDLKEFMENHLSRFDCITAVDVLEHFRKEEILALLDAVSEALKPGGRIIIRSPNAAGPFGTHYRYGDFSHELAFTKTSVTQVLTLSGFTDIQVHPAGPVVHGLLSACRWVLWQGIQLLLRLYLAAETGAFRGHILTQNLIAVARKPDSRGTSP